MCKLAPGGWLPLPTHDMSSCVPVSLCRKLAPTRTFPGQVSDWAGVVACGQNGRNQAGKLAM